MSVSMTWSTNSCSLLSPWKLVGATRLGAQYVRWPSAVHAMHCGERDQWLAPCWMGTGSHRLPLWRISNWRQWTAHKSGTICTTHYSGAEEELGNELYDFGKPPGITKMKKCCKFTCYYHYMKKFFERLLGQLQNREHIPQRWLPKCSTWTDFKQEKTESK